ncbi:MAG: hypothetical protein QXS02_02420 [Candidatus Thermoplasmatota archaeon]
MSTVYEIILEQMQLILTGVLVSLFSSMIYNLKPYGFKSFGKYRSKGEAILIYLSATIILGLLTPLIHILSGFILEYIPIVSIIGFLIFSTNFILNQTIPTWRHTTPKTLLIYTISILIIILGFFIRL